MLEKRSSGVVLILEKMWRWLGKYGRPLLIFGAGNNRTLAWHVRAASFDREITGRWLGMYRRPLLIFGLGILGPNSSLDLRIL